MLPSLNRQRDAELSLWSSSSHNLNAPLSWFGRAVNGRSLPFWGSGWVHRRGHQIFTYNRIHRSSDCVAERFLRFSTAMSLLSPIELSATEKLEILRRLDRYRKWQALDEKRYCLACGQIIDGHGLSVVGGTRGTGPLRVICPTRGCHSIPMDWVIPTDEVLARVSMLEQNEILPRKPIAPKGGKITQRLRKFATHFRRAA
jgi:hypothetical protein